MTRLSRRGFTLVELLVVIAIIGMLAALILPAVSAAKRAARRAQCANNSQNIGKAVLSFTSAKQRFPYLSSAQVMPGGPSGTSVSWVPPLLPMLERNDLYQMYVTSGGWTTGYQVPIAILICPEDTAKVLNTTLPGLSYAVNSGCWDASSAPFDAQENGIFFNQFKAFWAAPPVTPVQTDLGYVASHDGTATTVMFAENLNCWVWQTSSGVPGNPSPGGDDGLVSIIWPPGLGLNQGVTTGSAGNGNIARPSSAHGGGFYITFCDGHTQFMSQDVAPAVYSAIMTPFGRMARTTSGGVGAAGSANQSATVVSDAALNP